MSSIAVFLVLGGATAFAASKIGSNQLKANSVTTAKIKKEAITKKKIKKNAVDGSRVKDGSLTGADINLSTLGTVPSAENANNLTGLKPVAGSGANESVTTLFSNGQFDVVGICDPAGTLTIPGFDSGYNARHGSAIGIINRGQAHGWADTFDDDNENFEIGQGVAFDYLDGGDVGTAVLPNGHWVHVLGGTITEAATNPAFGTGCTFHAVVLFA
jgi:hypothetical protein